MLGFASRASGVRIPLVQHFPDIISGPRIRYTPPLYTDLKLHDVGTGDLTKENNSHGRGTKFDTPALHGLWLTAPYFHDGSVVTLQQVLRTGTTHNIVDRIDGSDLEDLITFILALPDDNDEPQ